MTAGVTKIFCDFYNRLLEKNITPDNVVENQKQVTDEFIALLIEKIKTPIQQQISNFSYKKGTKTANDVGISDSYRTFKAVYNYLLYLAHAGIIPDDVINCDDSKKATTLYEKVIRDVNKSNLMNLLKPLQEFYTLTKVIYTVSHAHGLADVGNWGEIAKAPDLPPFYDEL